MPIRVKCLPFGKLLQEFGVPYFLKVDIEGQEDQCLKALSRADLPRYVSWEASIESLAHLFWMHKLGYNAFKCIDQDTFRASLKRRRLSNSLLIRAGNRIRHVFSSSGAAMPVRRQSGWEFPPGSSGPFGEETDGRWQSFESLFDDWTANCRKTIRTKSDDFGWFDFHATMV